MNAADREYMLESLAVLSEQRRMMRELLINMDNRIDEMTIVVSCNMDLPPHESIDCISDIIDSWNLWKCPSCRPTPA